MGTTFKGRRGVRLLLLLGLVAGGCSSNSDGSSRGGRNVTPGSATSLSKNTDPWVLTCNNPSSPDPALLWNGLLGIRLSRSGSGLGADGKPLGFFMIDEYEPKGEEKILPLPNPILVSWSIGSTIYNGDKSKPHDFIKSGGTPLDITGKISDYNQTLDMRTGVLRTSWKQETDTGGLVGFQCDSVIHPSQRAIAQRWTVTCEKPTTFSVRSLDYSGPNDNQESIGGDQAQTVAISASNSRVVTLQSKLSGADPGATTAVGGFRVQEGTSVTGKPVVYERVICFGPHNPTPLPDFTEKNIDKLKPLAPKPLAFDDVANAAKKTWADRWKTDIVIDGPVADQQAVRSFLFYLRSAIDPSVNRSISPFGLSDQQYNGHVFWDSDIWVLPALNLVDPTEAASIAKYRLAMQPVAEGAFRTWFKQTQESKYPGMHQPAIGLKYPWESSVSGQETAPGDSKLEQHVTGSVIWGLTQAAAFGEVPVKTVDRAAALAANLFYSSGVRIKDGHFAINHVMSPDENHIGDNDLYTNLLANWLVSGRRWGPVSGLPFVVPHDDSGLITYDGDAFRGYKQAAAVLSIYPLQYPPAEADAAKMMARFEPRVIKNGPAMSDSLHALIWARTGEPEKAYTDWINSWQPFMRNDFMLFSEKRTKDQTYFTTGAAGSLQAVLYGFLGFRVDSKPQPGSAWQKSLMGHLTLSLKPDLPAEWKSVTFKNFTVLGSHFTLTASHSGAQVQQGD